MKMKNRNLFQLHSAEELNALNGREIKEKRTRSSKIYALGNGLYQAVVYPEPVHYKSSKGEWEEIDHSFSFENDFVTKSSSLQ